MRRQSSNASGLKWMCEAPRRKLPKCQRMPAFKVEKLLLAGRRRVTREASLARADGASINMPCRANGHGDRHSSSFAASRSSTASEDSTTFCGRLERCRPIMKLRDIHIKQASCPLHGTTLSRCTTCQDEAERGQSGDVNRVTRQVGASQNLQNCEITNTPPPDDKGGKPTLAENPADNALSECDSLGAWRHERVKHAPAPPCCPRLSPRHNPLCIPALQTTGSKRGRWGHPRGDHEPNETAISAAPTTEAQLRITGQPQRGRAIDRSPNARGASGPM